MTRARVSINGTIPLFSGAQRDQKQEGGLSFVPQRKESRETGRPKA
jgi:hypothetical protein